MIVKLAILIGFGVPILFLGTAFVVLANRLQKEAQKNG